MTVKLPPGVSLGPVSEGGVIADSEWGYPVDPVNLPLVSAGPGVPDESGDTLSE